MINASTLLDAYLDVNVLLLLVCVLWFVFSRVLDRLGLAHAVTARLRMLRSVFIAVLMAPAFAALIVMAGQVGFAAPAQTVNLTDFIVAQYLQGRFAMNPSALEELLLLRSRLAEAAFTPAGRAILGLIAVGGVACFLRLGWSVVRLCRITAALSAPSDESRAPSDESRACASRARSASSSSATTASAIRAITAAE